MWIFSVASSPMAEIEWQHEIDFEDSFVYNSTRCLNIHILFIPLLVHEAQHHFSGDACPHKEYLYDFPSCRNLTERRGAAEAASANSN